MITATHIAAMRDELLKTGSFIDIFKGVGGIGRYTGVGTSATDMLKNIGRKTGVGGKVRGHVAEAMGSAGRRAAKAAGTGGETVAEAAKRKVVEGMKAAPSSGSKKGKNRARYALAALGGAGVLGGGAYALKKRREKKEKKRNA